MNLLWGYFWCNLNGDGWRPLFIAFKCVILWRHFPFNCLRKGLFVNVKKFWKEQAFCNPNRSINVNWKTMWRPSFNYSQAIKIKELQARNMQVAPLLSTRSSTTSLCKTNFTKNSQDQTWKYFASHIPKSVKKTNNHRKRREKTRNHCQICYVTFVFSI